MTARLAGGVTFVGEVVHMGIVLALLARSLQDAVEAVKRHRPVHDPGQRHSASALFAR